MTFQIPDMLVDDRKDEGTFRVHRSSMVSDEIHQKEIERIFERCWLYVGHESELKEAGEYRRRNVVGRSIIFVRSDDGEIRTFHNTCPHRGAIVCRQDSGVAKAFQCFYHAWTFNSRGELKGMPGKEGYEGSAFDQAERSLKEVARHESYAGFHFISFRKDIESLEDYLAGAKEFLDLISDQSPSNTMKVVDGSHRYSMRANWKLLAENSVDGYHGMPTHQTYFQYVAEAGGLGKSEKGLHGRGYALGNGHGVAEYWAPWGRPVARWVPMMGEESREPIEKARAEITERHGEERATRICEWNRNMVIYPNLVINDIMATTIRTFWPVGPGLMEVDAWALAPVEEQEGPLATRLHNFLEFLGPGGFATPDDVEALESCQIGFQSEGEQWNDVSRGMKREAQIDDELQIRTWWRQWAADIEGREIDDWGDDPPEIEVGVDDGRLAPRRVGAA